MPEQGERVWVFFKSFRVISLLVHGRCRGQGGLREVQLRSLRRICPASPQPLLLASPCSCPGLPGGSINVLFPGKDNRDTQKTEMNKVRSFIMQKLGFGALQLKEAAAPAHSRGACSFYPIEVSPF